MSADSSRKRAGEGESQEDPPRKIASGQLDETDSNQNYVVIIVEGQKFPCQKESLSNCSKYFEKMFNSGFSENGQKEVKLEGIATADGFKLFLDVTGGNNILTGKHMAIMTSTCHSIFSDECVEQALSLADYLESPVLEDKCIEFLSKESEYSKEEQFALGDKHNSLKLMAKICSGIKDSYELHEIVPVDINSLKSSTKTIVLQKSFELHGHRKPPAPPLSQQKEAVFEKMVDDFIDQAAVVNHHGRILAEQAFLLYEHVTMNDLMSEAPRHIKELIEQDSRIPILTSQLQKAENQIEKNAIEAQIQVIHRKDCIMGLEMSLVNNQDLREGLELFIDYLLETLKRFPYLINRGMRTENIALRNYETGERTVDVQYRNITREFEERGLPEGELLHQQSWLQSISDRNSQCVRQMNVRPGTLPVPDGLRQVPREINFGTLIEFVANVRQCFYNIRLRPVVIQVQNQPAQPDPQLGGEHQNDGDEPIQEGAEQDGQE
ncbi:unnamed protein product [Caenorhabditis brenneri]